MRSSRFKIQSSLTKNKEQGFTLLEVVIAVSIMAVLSFYTAQSISSAVKSKAKVQTDIDRTALLRAAMNVIKEDLHRSFNYRDPNIELYNRAGSMRQVQEQQRQMQGQGNAGAPGAPSTSDQNDQNPATGAPGAPGAPGTPLPPFQPRPEMVFTGFKGDKNSVYFTSLNNARTQTNQGSSEQMKVGYFLRNCRSRKDPGKNSQCLVRRKSDFLDDKIDEGGDEMVLLENVTRFELQYLGPIRGADWQGNWRSDDGQDASMRGQFPVAVEVTLEHHDKTNPQAKATAMTIVAEIRNPNNPQDLPPEEQQAQGMLQQQMQQGMGPGMQPGMPGRPGMPGQPGGFGQQRPGQGFGGGGRRF